MTKSMKETRIFTVGHSTHEFEDFVSLLKLHGIDAVADVRSVPYSRWQPQFNREALAKALKGQGLAYVFLGEELGARSGDSGCYEKGRVKYRKIAETPLFRAGIARIRNGCSRWRIALMCAEKDPLVCHRTILVARELVAGGAKVAHILEDGMLEPHKATMKRLSEQLRLPVQDLFLTAEELEDRAYAAQEQRIAYLDAQRINEAQEAGE